MSPRFRRAAWGFGGVVAVVAHFLFWYQPRARPERLATEGPVAEILGDPSFPVAVWVPWPHQNFAWLERRAGLDRETWGAVARLAGLETDLPSFGSLAVAPASDLVVARGRGERWALRARVYPTVAGFARLSGHLADNPWLAGGAVRIRGGGGNVDWNGRWWRVAVGQPPGPGAAANPDGPALALLRVGSGADPLPAGVFGLHRVGTGLEVRPERVEAPPIPTLPPPTPGEPERILTLLGEPGPTGGPRQALALFAAPGGAANDLPAGVRAVRVGPDAVDPWPLPGADLLRVAGRDAPGSTVGAWSLEATGNGSLAAGERLVAALDPVAGDAGRRLEWVLWVELPAAKREVARVSRIVDQLPFFGRRTRERWRDALRVLESLSEAFDRLVLVVGRDPDALLVRLEGARSAASGIDGPPENP